MSRHFGNWFTNLAKHLRHTPACGTGRARLGVEALEDRWCPACQVYPVNTSTGTYLYILGDDSANQVRIDQNDNQNTIEVTCDGQAPVTFTSHLINAFYINLKDGDDELRWRQESSLIWLDKKATIRLGNGVNEAVIDFRGPTSNADLYGNWQISVEGGNQRDDVYAVFGRKIGGEFSFTANLGKGDDDADVDLAGNVSSAADVRIELNGSSGKDTLSSWIGYLTVGSVDVSFDSRVEVVLNGGHDADLLDFDYAGELDGDLVLRLNGHYGNDTLQANLLTHSDSDGTVDANVNGNGNDDSLWFRLEKTADSDLEIINAILNGGGNYDTWNWINTTSNVTVSNCEAKTPTIVAVAP